MNDRSSNDNHDDDHDPLALLEDANPVPIDSTVPTRPAPQALFEEIIMTDTDTPLRSVPDAAVDTAGANRPAPPSRRRWLLPAVAAAALVATAAVAVWPNGGQTAAAAVRAAAASTESATSGTVEVFVAYSDAGEDGTVRFVSRFFGDDSETVVSSETGEIEIPDTWFRVVDGRTFTRGLYEAEGSAPDSPWLEVTDVDGVELVPELGLPGAVSANGTAGLVALLEHAEDVERSGDDTYTATITVGDARTLAEVPAGLSFLTDDDSELADDQVLGVEAHVGDDGRLDELVIDFVEQDSDTDSSARIEVMYDDLDAGEPIEVPADVEPMPDPMSQIPAELEEPLRIITEFMESNPDVCQDDIEPDDLVTCLRSIGADDVADAMEVISEYYESPQP